MASEAYRGLLRLLSNYSRLGASLILGLIYVPVFLLWLGEEAFGLLTLMGASIGIAAMATEISRKAMLRELSAAHHGADAGWFASVYNSAFVVSLAAAAVTLAGFGVILLLLPFFPIPDHLTVAARWLVVGHGSSIVIGILLQPVNNMYLVKERFFLDNVWIVAHKSAYLGAGLVLIYGFHVTEPAAALIAFAIALAAVQISLLFLQAGTMVFLDRRLLLQPRSISGRALRIVSGDFGIQTFVTLAMNIHERIAQVIVFLIFGPVGATIYGVSLRLSAYCRMFTLGATGGLETVSARIGSSTAHSGAVKDLLYHTTRLHAFVSIPAALAIFILAEPLLTLWVGRALSDPSTSIPIAVTLVQILMFALVSRSISDGWIAVLYGTGHLKRYAPLLIVGGVLNPPLTLLLIAVLPDAWKFNAPAIAFAVILTTLHFGMLPAVAARCFEVAYSDVVTPMLRPTLVAFAFSPILIYGAAHFHQSILGLAATMGAYAIAYAVGSWVFTLTAQERRRFGGAALRRLELIRVRGSVSDSP